MWDKCRTLATLIENADIIHVTVSATNTYLQKNKCNPKSDRLLI